MNPNDVQIESSWKELLKDEFERPYFDEIASFLKSEKKNGKVIYPPGSLIFNAFKLTPVRKVKVVILGQDPYHGPGQAMGLSFSVPKGVRVPASLRNIYKEIRQDVGASVPEHGDLTAWAKQGVLLLNAMLTVEHKQAGSHKKIGWQHFTNKVIRRISQDREHLVFMLWGNYAQSKSEFIDDSKHLVLKSYHPSPLAGNGFFNNHHFSKCNAYLISHRYQPIDWQIY